MPVVTRCTLFFGLFTINIPWPRRLFFNYLYYYLCFMHKQPSAWKAYLALFIGIVCISWSAIFVKLAHVPGEAAAFYRMFGCLLLSIWLIDDLARSERDAVEPVPAPAAKGLPA